MPLVNKSLLVIIYFLPGQYGHPMQIHISFLELLGPSLMWIAFCFLVFGDGRDYSFLFLATLVLVRIGTYSFLITCILHYCFWSWLLVDDVMEDEEWHWERKYQCSLFEVSFIACYFAFSHPSSALIPLPMIIWIDSYHWQSEVLVINKAILQKISIATLMLMKTNKCSLFVFLTKWHPIGDTHSLHVDHFWGIQTKYGTKDDRLGQPYSFFIELPVAIIQRREHSVFSWCGGWLLLISH